MGETEHNRPDPRLGRVLMGQYRLDALLGEGGMGAVYRGEQLSVQRPVAIKLIAGKVAENPECVRRFRREAEAMAKLRHPSTVRLYEFGVADADTAQSELFMVMELLEGADLSEHLLRRGQLPPSEALSITRQVLEALAEAHALGIVHRDLKPANIFLSHVHGGKTLAKVMDFGIAGIEQSQQSTKLTLTGAVMGTPAYMSPEQAQGKLVDGRSDLYSLGVVLFEMLAGKPPFEADSAVSLLLAQVSTPPPRLFELTAQLAPLQRLLDQLLDKNPEARPASAQAALELVDQVQRQLESTPGLAQTPVPAPRSVSFDSSSHGAQAQGTLASLPPSKPAKWPWLAGAVALGLATLLLWPRSSAPSAPPPVPQLSARPGAPPAPAAPQLFTVQLVSKPAGAAIELSGVEIGRTPYAVQFRRATQLRLSLPGHVSQELELDEHSEPIRVVELEPVAQTVRKGGARPSSNPPPQPPAVTASSASAHPQAPTSNAASAPAPAARVVPATTAPVVLPPPSWLSQPRPALSDRDRREQMLQRGAPYRNVVSAKRAYREGKLSEQAYEDTIWVLKTVRNQRIQAEKQSYKRGAISRDELERRIDRIDAEYQGR